MSDTAPIRDPGMDALIRMTQNILRANGYDVEPNDLVVWCGTCAEAARTSPWRYAWYRYNMSVQLWLDRNDSERAARLRAERQATIRSPVPGRDPEYVRLVAERKRRQASVDQSEPPLAAVLGEGPPEARRAVKVMRR